MLLAACLAQRPVGLAQQSSVGCMLRSNQNRALWRKRPRVSRDACLWWDFLDFERWAGSGFKPSKRNDGSGEGSAKKERSTGVRDDQRTCISGTRHTE